MRKLAILSLLAIGAAAQADINIGSNYVYAHEFHRETDGNTQWSWLENGSLDPIPHDEALNDTTFGPSFELDSSASASAHILTHTSSQLSLSGSSVTEALIHNYTNPDSFDVQGEGQVWMEFTTDVATTLTFHEICTGYYASSGWAGSTMQLDVDSTFLDDPTGVGLSYTVNLDPGYHVFVMSQYSEALSPYGAAPWFSGTTMDTQYTLDITAAAVPEPATILLLTPAVLALRRRRQGF